MTEQVDQADADQVNAEPTKSFFIDMLTRDIALEQAVLDLVDNSVDGAKASPVAGEHPYEGRTVRLEFDKTRFRIWDNCGGFDREKARTYAFRFGRAAGAKSTPHSIGQFGVGMKRALFKFGNEFVVRSATKTDNWAVKVKVSEWESQSGWHFPWADFVPDASVSTASPGTEIVVTGLRPEVGAKFSTQNFENAIFGLIKSKHRQFISGGLKIIVNDKHVDASSLYLLMTDDAKFAPGVEELTVNGKGLVPVKVRIVVGIGHSSPKDAGWYVVCNGRVILEADRRSVTGWGWIEEQTKSLALPAFHNQFARFRGIVTFDSDDSGRVPWNTTKTDVDQDSPVWESAFTRMLEMTRPVINFLNELDSDIDEHTRESSPLLKYVSGARAVKSDELTTKRQFTAPPRSSLTKTERTVKVQFSKPVGQVGFLMEELGVPSAKAVGERAFELTYERMGGK